MRTLKHASIDRFDNSERDQGVIVGTCYNFKNTSLLRADSGIANATFPLTASSTETYSIDFESSNVSSVVSADLFRQYVEANSRFDSRLIIYAGNNKLYFHNMFSSDDSVYTLYNITMSSAPKCFVFKKDGLDTLVIVNSEKMIVWSTGLNPLTYTGLPEVTSMCIYNNELYCNVKNPAYKVWHSSTISPSSVGTTDDNSGYIEFEDCLGDVQKLVVLNNNLYAIMEYGIFKVEKDEEDSYVMTKIFDSNTKIFPNTVAVSGIYLIFLTKNGLFQFNGYLVSKINVKFKGYLDDVDSNVVGACLGNDYYLAFKHNFDDDEIVLCENGQYKNNAVLILDLADNSYHVMRGMDVKSFTPLKTEQIEKMLVCFNSYDNSYLGEIVKSSKSFNREFPKYWSSGSLTESKAKKLATALVVDCSKGVKITLIYDNKKRQFLATKDGVNEFNFKITAKDFKVEIFSVQPVADVDSLTLDYYED